ncbi:hypothetical protein, partial [Fluoribacter dumoffii]
PGPITRPRHKLHPGPNIQPGEGNPANPNFPGQKIHPSGTVQPNPAVQSPPVFKHGNPPPEMQNQPIGQPQQAPQ